LRMSLENFKEGLKDYFLELGWKQWTKLGISGRERADDWVNTDPEALVLLAGFLGSKDLRLTDNVISWLATNESLIHKSRLKTILDIGHVPTLLRLSEVFQAAGKGDERSSWNTFKDYSSDKIKALEDRRERNKELFASEMVSGDYKTVKADLGNNRVILRKLFGTTVRAELINFFFGRGSGSSRAIAEYLQLSQSTVYTTLNELEEIGLIKKQGRSRSTTYRIVENSFSLPRLQPEVYFDWANYFKSIIKAWKHVESLTEPDSEYKVRSALNQFYRKFLEDLSDWNSSFAKLTTPTSSRAQTNIVEKKNPAEYLLNEITRLPGRAVE